MIEIFSPANTVYGNNGDMVLTPSKCECRAKINGAWVVELTHPIDDFGRWKYIEINSVLRVPSFNGEQLFRIRSLEKNDSEVTATAEPVFLDARGDCFILDSHLNNLNGQAALNAILSPNSKYKGKSDILSKNTAYYVRKNAIEALASDDDNSFLNRWGGEILYDNYQISINQRIGGYYGASLLYGKNIPVDGMRESIDMDNVVTRIIPKAYNGRLIDSATPWVDSPNIKKYPIIITKVIEYENIRLKSDIENSDVEDTGEYIICKTQEILDLELKKAANKEFDKGIDKPEIVIECEMALLENTIEYSDIRDLEKVSLGDTIYCKHNKLGIVTEARVMELVYNCITKSTESIVIGSIKRNYLDDVSSVINATTKAVDNISKIASPDGEVRAERVRGVLNGHETQLKIQNANTRVILFEDTNPNSSTFGALAMGVRGLEYSDIRLQDDTGWDWSKAVNSRGIIADAITSGLLSDNKSLTYWDLDTGEFKLSPNTTIEDQTVYEIAESFASLAVDSLTQLDIFNKLTNNANAKLLSITDDGQLYVNGTYIKSGIIKDAAKLNSWNLKTGELSLSEDTKIVDKSISEFIDSRIDLQTQDFIFNKLTRNGESEGLELKDDDIYLNSSKLEGAIEDSVGKNRWDLDTGEMSLSKDILIDGKTIEEIIREFAPDVSADDLTIDGSITVDSIVARDDIFGQRMLSGSIEIVEEDDLNDERFWNRGEYRCLINVPSAHVSNCPSLSSFRMFVVSRDDNDVPPDNYYYLAWQILLGLEGRIFLRRGVKMYDGLEWSFGQWIEFDSTGRADLTKTGNIAAGGNISGTNGVFSGDVSGVKGTFSGDVSGAKGIFTDDVSGVDGSFTGEVSAPNGDFGVIDSNNANINYGEIGNLVVLGDASVYGDLSSRKGVFSDDISADRVLPAFKLLEANANLNSVSCLNRGEYRCNSGSVAATISNCPTTYPFHMWVIELDNRDSDSSTDLYIWQIVLDRNNRSWNRYSKKVNGSWTFGNWIGTVDDRANTASELATVSPITVTTLTAGSPSSSNGGCYYYKIGTRVHVHMGVTGLTRGSWSSIFTMPAGYKPYSLITGSSWAGYTAGVPVDCGCRMTSAGVIQALTQSTSGTVILDFEYDSFS